MLILNLYFPIPIRLEQLLSGVLSICELILGYRLPLNVIDEGLQVKIIDDIINITESLLADEYCHQQLFDVVRALFLSFKLFQEGLSSVDLEFLEEVILLTEVGEIEALWKELILRYVGPPDEVLQAIL